MDEREQCRINSNDRTRKKTQASCYGELEIISQGEEEQYLTLDVEEEERVVQTLGECRNPDAS